MLMQLLRRVVRFCLGAQSIILFGAFALILVSVGTLGTPVVDDDSPISSVRMMIGATLVFPFLGILPALAWWKLKKDKPTARRWALAASALNTIMLPAGLEGIRRFGAISLFSFYAFCGITGMAGLLAFWQNNSPAASARRVRIAGDGTSKLKDYAAQGIAVAIIWFSMEYWNRWSHTQHLSYPGFLTFLTQMEIAVLVSTLGHELGHLVAGWASGKILRSFQVGPFAWAIRNGVWRFTFNLRKFHGGSVGMVSPDVLDMRSRKAFFVIGGPVASLATGSIFIVATLLVPGTAWEPYWLFLSMIANFSLAAFVVNLMPLKPESNYSDGAQLYQIVTNGPWARVHFAFAMVSTSIVAPVRPRDFDVDVITEAAKSVPTGERGLMLRLFACLHYLDTGQISKAVDSIDQAGALYEGSVFEKPQDICTEFVFVNAFHKRDLAAAELWSQRIDALPKIDRDADYWRARTSLLWLRGDRTEAREAWERGHALAMKLPSAGSYDFTRSCYEKLRIALDAPVQLAPPSLASIMALASAHAVPVEA